MPNVDPRKHFWIKDARGRKVAQFDPVAMQLLRQYDVIDADALRQIAHEKGVGIRSQERIFLIVGVVGAISVIGLFSYEGIFGGLRDAGFAKTSGLLYLCAAPWILWHLVRLSRRDSITAAMLKHLRCPHCGYDLRLLPPDAGDNATVCPECGCAWKLEAAHNRKGQVDG